MNLMDVDKACQDLNNYDKVLELLKENEVPFETQDGDILGILFDEFEMAEYGFVIDVPKAAWYYAFDSDGHFMGANYSVGW